MKSKNNNRSFRTRRRKKVILKRITVLSLLLISTTLIVFLGWQVARGISAAFATEDRPVSEITTTQPEEHTTTTTRSTISVNAPLFSPRIMVYDVTNSSLLYSKDAEARCYPASLTKLLTAMVATDYCTKGEEITVGSELSLIQPNSSTAGLKTGYRFTRDMLIDALLLRSGNDAAYTIAVHVGRKVTGDYGLNDFEAVFAFSELMNNKAQSLGLSNSHFTNPDGYFSPDHYTTASDMLNIAVAASSYENIMQTVSKRSVQHVLLSGQQVTFTNTNVILNPSSPYYFEGATGMKTGFTNQSGHCVVVSAERDGVKLMVVVMGGSTTDARWQDALSLLNQAFAAQ